MPTINIPQKFSSFSSIRACALACVFTVVLAGCGGGGGGSSGGSSSSSSGTGASNLPSFPVNPATARSLVGGTVLDETSSEVGASLDAIHQAANSLLVGDNHLFVPGSSVGRADTTCAAASCTTTSGGASLTQTLADNDFGDSSINYQSVMTDIGIPLAQGRSRLPTSGVSGGITDTISYGGWLEHSFFFAQVLEQTAPGDDPLAVGYGVSIGNAPGTNPAAVASETGATWSGVMIGGDVSDTALFGNVIQGDAEIDIDDFNNPDVDIRFTNIYDLDAGNTRASMSWNNISVRNGAFATGAGTNQIQGKFYGPNHEEVGGVFERNNVVGTFGAQR